MKSVFITGTGRSGTSMLAGTFARTGTFMGRHLYSASSSNPKGYLEDPEVNMVNESIIMGDIAERAGVSASSIEPSLFEGQLWLSQIPFGARPSAGQIDRRRIIELTKERPFCFKDPRFTQTLEAWIPFAPEAIIICIFRDPIVTIASTLAEVQRAPYLRSLPLSVNDVEALWSQAYARVLRLYRDYPSVFLVSYDSVLDKSALPLLENLAECALDMEFPDSSLNRTVADSRIQLSDQANAIHEVLRQVSESDLGRGRTRERLRSVDAIVDKAAATVVAPAWQWGTRPVAERVCALRLDEHVSQADLLRQQLEQARREQEVICATAAQRETKLSEARREEAERLRLERAEAQREAERLRLERAYELDKLARLGDRLSRLHELERCLEEEQRRNAMARSRTADLEQRITELEERSSEAGRERDTARAELGVWKEHVAALRTSTSWRVTAPIRWAGPLKRKFVRSEAQRSTA